MLKKNFYLLIMTVVAVLVLLFSLASCNLFEEKEGDIEYILVVNNYESYYVLKSAQNCNDKEITIPAKYKGLPVKEINTDAFNGCTELEKLVIPNSVTLIGSNAFGFCVSLKSISIPASVTEIAPDAFNFCSSLSSIEVDEKNPAYKAIDGNLYSKDGKILVRYFMNRPETEYTVVDGVESIGECAFHSAINLEKIILPDSVNLVEANAFENCVYMTSFNFGKNVKTIGEHAFSYCLGMKSIEIPGSVTEIESNAFRNCESLESIEFEEGLCSIGNSAFENCTALKSIKLPSTITDLEGDAFSGCVSLENVLLNDGLEYIGSMAFAGCTSLKSIHIPNTINTVMVSPFYGCTDLSSITVDEDSENIKVIDNVLYMVKEGLLLVQYPFGKGESSFNIPDEVTAIGESAFYGCETLKSIYIGNNVKKIDAFAFADCIGLESVTIGDSVSIIGTKAFYNCEKLESIVIPDNVTELRNGAFEGCKNLLSVHIGNGVTKINNSFSSCEKLERIYLGISVNNVSSNDFIGCANLKEIVIDGNNETYKSINGNIYSVDGKTLLIYIRYADEPLEFEIPSGVTTIKQSAFSAGASFETIVISADVTKIEIPAFTYCENLKNIVVDENNSAYSSIDGNLYSKDKKTLLQYAIGKKEEVFIIPDCVTRVGNNVFGKGVSAYRFVFNYNSKIAWVTSIRVGSGKSLDLEKLGYVHVQDFVNESVAIEPQNGVYIKKIVIPKSIVSLNSNSFSACGLLDELYYAGTEAEWNKLNIIETIDTPTSLYEKLIDTFNIRFYSEKKPTLHGSYWHYNESGEPVAW